MIRKYLFFLMIFPVILLAKEADSTKNKFHPSFDLGLNISQISFTNWIKGGENSLTWTLTGDVKLDYSEDEWSFKNRVKSAFGRTKIGSQNFRTNDNELFIESVLSYNVGWKVDPYISNIIRTQITEGFDYKTEPKKKIADIFDPGYVTQSMGFNFDKGKLVKSRLGIAIQETFTNRFRQYSDDNRTKGKIEAFKLESGMESVTHTEFTIDTNLKMKSMLRLFTRFEHIDVWDVRWDNNIVAKVNSWLNVNFNFLLIYEKNQSLDTQIKQALQVGIIYNVI